ncbi:MAG: rod shape-determining protein MreD [Oscillospiraceae bacterium]|nr:rod shape-determining protein MreD [Oscillospiraceae bacterium]
MKNRTIKIQQRKIPVKAILNVLFFILALPLQFSVVEHVSIFGVRPNLPLVISIITGIIEGSVYGGATGLFTGLYMDAMTGKTLGVQALFGLYAGVLAGMSSKKHKGEKILTVTLITYVISVLFESCVYLFGYVVPIIGSGAEIRAGFIYAFARIILPAAMLNTLIGIPVFMMLRSKKVNDIGDDIDVQEIY